MLRHRSPAAPVPVGAPPPELVRRLVVLFAVAAGLSVAGIYYAQPLLPAIARDFGIGEGHAGLLVTAAQIGYALGLTLVVPLGDLLEARRLIVALSGLAALCTAAMALAPDPGLLLAAAVAVGACSVVAQTLVPLAATLAEPARRGQVVGSVMTGLLLGILLARTAAGLLATTGSWRAVYAAATVLLAALTVVLRRELPAVPARTGIGYLELLRSTLGQFRTHPVLRWRAAYGSLGFASFSVLWTALAFLLAGPPYRYPTSVIGLFGLVGAAGALAANFAGRLADRGRTATATAVAAGLLAVSWLFLWLGAHSLAALLAGIVILDIAVQGLQITNQSVVYGLDARARGRLTSAYMTCYFIGGALGSALAGLAYARGGWGLTCSVGVALCAVQLGILLVDRLRRP